MKTRLFLAFLTLCLPLSCYAQEGQSGPGLPPPSVPKIGPAETGVKLPPTPVTAGNWPCHGDSPDRANRSYTAVRERPEVGNKIRGYPPVEPMPATGGGYAKGSEPRYKYRIIFDELMYDVTADEKGVTRRVSTDDPGFKTPEGIAVGDPLEKALASSRRKPGGMKPCLYYVELKSGWNALLSPNDVAKDGTVAPGARVAAFFKER